MANKAASVTSAMRKMTGARARFNETMIRCDTLIQLYDSTKNDDLLRAVVVLCVAALERYLKDRFLELFIPFLKREQRKNGIGKWNKHTEELLTDSGVNEDFWKTCAINPMRNFAKISTKVRNHVRKMTLQNRGVIEHLYTCYGISIIQHAVGIADRKLLWGSVAKLIKRRHQVTHHSDYLNAGKLDEIDKKEIVRRLGHVKKLVDCIDDILILRFKKNGRKGAGNKNVKCKNKKK